jgi:hypothetical protein
MLALTACSVVRLGYNNGETILYWWLDSYADIDSDQKPMVHQGIDNFFAWHRRTQLRDYAQMLALGQKRLGQSDLTEAVLEEDYAQCKKKLFLMADNALPNLADIALALRPHQIEHIEKEFASDSEDYRKDYLSGDTEERQRVRYKELLKQAEYWFGSFSSEQKEKIRAASDARPLNNELWLEEKNRRQQELISLLKKVQKERPDRETVMAWLKTYIEGFDAEHYGEHYGNPENKVFYDAYRKSMVHTAFVIIKLTTPEQKNHAIHRLQKWIDDFQALAV